MIDGGHVHHVPHLVPVAQRLAELRPDWLIFVTTLTGRTARAVEQFRDQYAPDPGHIRLRPDGLFPRLSTDREAVLRESDVVPSFDAVVTADGRKPARGARSILICAGGGDHDLPLPCGAGFERVLVAGEKARMRMIEAGGVASDRIVVSGSPILDLPAARMRLWPADGRRTVLYNPHWSPQLSSWFRWGRAILDWFADHPDYRLILAPHPQLFARRFARSPRSWWPHPVPWPEARHLRAPNIHVDLDSSLLSTRAYAESADIYLGDANGQLYEFLARPRPCGFLNAHGALDPADRRFTGWSAGHVIDDVRQLGELLHVATEWHPQIYRPVQEQLFASSLSVTGAPAALRAAMAISDCLDPAGTYAASPEPCRA